MKYVRIRSYRENGEFTTCEHAYAGNDQAKALERFRREMQEQKDCILVAETIDDQDEDWKEWFRIARGCGCVHFF